MGNRKNRKVVVQKNNNNVAIERLPREGDLVYSRYMGIAIIVEVSHSNKGLCYCKFYHPHCAYMEGAFSYAEMGPINKFLDEHEQ